jgi:predicted RNA binding protein YcfA (HicA-like mRNA interferase family)
MARQPRVTAPRLIRGLEQAGFVRVRVKGSHWIYRHSVNRRRVTVPYHRTQIIPPGTLTNILREAGLTGEELDQLL